MSATARMEFRLTPEERARIDHAAALAGEPVTAFARTAAEERAERVLRAHESTTVVPDEYFDELLAALEQPAAPNAALRSAWERVDETVRRA